METENDQTKVKEHPASSSNDLLGDLLPKADYALRMTCKLLRGSENPDHLRAVQIAESWLNEYHTRKSPNAAGELQPPPNNQK